jgi:hypothetical protein
MWFKLTQKQLFRLFGALGVIFTVASIALVCALDTIVHGLLYEYGLVFDYGWASPYWNTLRTLLVMLAALFILSFIPIAGAVKAALFSLLGRRTPQAASTRGDQLQSTVPPAPKAKEATSPQASTTPQEMADAVEVSAVPMICNKCGKVFNQPLSMFDFRTGNPRLVHVCPYCNAVLAVAGSPGGK